MIFVAQTSVACCLTVLFGGQTSTGQHNRHDEDESLDICMHMIYF